MLSLLRTAGGSQIKQRRSSVCRRICAWLAKRLWQGILRAMDGQDQRHVEASILSAVSAMSCQVLLHVVGNA